MLFFIALWAEKNAKSRWINNPIVYSLSLGIFCSAWTYYGGIGVAAKSGVFFLPTFLGPVIASPLWIVVLRKVMRISKPQKISSIADFIALRYGNNRFVGALVTFTCIVAILPYISLQLKAISETFEILTQGTITYNYDSENILLDSTFYIAVLIALFASFFGTQSTDTTNKHIGIVASVALESVLKLVFFLIIGIYVTFFLFDGTEDIYNRFSELHNMETLTTFSSLYDGFDWFYMIVISFIAIFLLPRQFQIMVVENDRERYLKYAIWMFPLYLLIFNLFVIYIAWGGNLTFGGSVNPEYYSLLLPMQNGNIWLTLLVFLGGLSAIISMVVVSTIALSTMLSNNVIIPYGYLKLFSKQETEINTKYIKTIRRVSIFCLIIASYLFYINFSVELSLFSIGYISFVIITQLAPSFFLGLYWNRGAGRGAKIGIIAGLIITFYTLILPFTLNNPDFIENGPFGVHFLRPYQLLGIDFLNPVSHAFFWSMFFNLLCYLTFSLVGSGKYRERNYAEMFVRSASYSSLQEEAYVWKGEAYVSDIKQMLVRFLGVEPTEKAFENFYERYNLPKNTLMADARMVNFSEKLLTGSVGSISARILISSAIKEEPVSLDEVVQILEESKETMKTNRFLREKSEQLTQLTTELKRANEELLVQDKQKDEFLDTVAHELKTPITAIKASAEVLIEDNEMPYEIQSRFLNNIIEDSERLTRLINNILDIEKLASGRERLDLRPNNIIKPVDEAIHLVSADISKKNIKIINEVAPMILYFDEDRIIQVFTNLLANAVKFVEKDTGEIRLTSDESPKFFVISIADNGKGIPEEDFNYIFDKFYQSKNQNTKKPQGSGFGLAICKHIVESHGGNVYADPNVKNGAKFVVKLPK